MMIQDASPPERLHVWQESLWRAGDNDWLHIAHNAKHPDPQVDATIGLNRTGIVLTTSILSGSKSKYTVDATMPLA